MVEMAIDQPAFGQLRASNELKKKGIVISPGGVRSIWMRHNLYAFKFRLKALEAKSAQEGIVLTEAQLAALERAREEEKAIGEIETRHPCYLGALDTYLRWGHQGCRPYLPADVRRHLFQVAFTRLYDRKNALVAADMLNDRVVPFYEEHEVAQGC